MPLIISSGLGDEGTDLTIQRLECSLAVEIDTSEIVVVVEECSGGTLMADINLKQGEQKVVAFTVTEDSVAVDLTGAVLTWTVEECPGTDIITKADGDFDKTDEATGVVRITLLEADTLTIEPDTYAAELKIVLAGGNIEKSATQTVKIARAIT